jgi:hypothetical protein
MKKHKYVKQIAEGEYLGLARSAAPVVPAHDFKIDDRVVLNNSWGDWSSARFYDGEPEVGTLGTVVERPENGADRDDLLSVLLDHDKRPGFVHQFHMKFLNHAYGFPKVGDAVKVNPERDAMGVYPNGLYTADFIDYMEMDAQNAGVEIAARLLGDIARGGEHKGTFGGVSLEATAQQILTMRKAITTLEEQIHVKDKTIALYADEKRLRDRDLLYGRTRGTAQERQTEWSTHPTLSLGSFFSGDNTQRAVSEQGISVPQADGDSDVPTVASTGSGEKEWEGLGRSPSGRDDAATESESRVSLGRQVGLLEEREEMYRQALNAAAIELGGVDLDQVVGAIQALKQAW